MRSRVSVQILMAFVLCGVAQSFWEYRLESRIEDTEQALSKVVGESPGYAGEDMLSQARRVLTQSQMIESLTYLSTSAYLLEARARLEVYRLANNVDVLCQGIVRLSKLISAAPSSSESYVLLAEMISQIGNIESCEIKSVLPLDNVLERVNRLSPVDTAFLYRGGVAALNAGEASLGLSMLSKAQILDPGFTDDQKSFLFDLVYNQADLKVSLPSSYPAVAEWLSYFYNQRRYNFDLWQDEFIVASHKAISDLDRRYRSGIIGIEPLSDALKAIALLPLSYVDDSLRTRLDTILYRIYSLEGATRWASFIEERSQLKRVPVLKSVAQDDRDSRTQQLHGWMPDTASVLTEFDKLGNAIGLFIPEGWQPHYIVIQGELGARVEKDLALDIWVSEDNQRFYPVKLESLVQQLTVDGIDRIVIPAQTLTVPYVKIRYRGSNQDPHLINRYARLVEVYGVSNGL